MLFSFSNEYNLIQNGLGTNNNKDYYDYIITEIYDLPFKKKY